MRRHNGAETFLVRALLARFGAHVAQHPQDRVVLWFDPYGEYGAVVEAMGAAPPLIPPGGGEEDWAVWRYDGSLLALRYRLLHLGQETFGEQRKGETLSEHGGSGRVIVYLPVPQQEAEVLQPFFATSLCFSESLYRFLRSQGVDFPDDPEVAHALRELLPRLAARSLGKGREFWTHNLANLERARETLLGNFDDTLLRFLAAPAETMRTLEAEQMDGLFFAQLESRYGLTVPEAEAGPRAIAAHLVAHLALVRAFEDAGQPADFPYAASLPQPMYFPRCRAFLERWQRDSAYKVAYVRFAETLERDYDLASWSARLPFATAVDVGGTFVSMEQDLWARAQEAMTGLEGEAAWCGWLAAHRAAFAARARDFWAQEDRAPWWTTLTQAADLLLAIREARADLDTCATPEALLRRYSTHWWCIDRDFRALREALDRHPTAYDPLRRRCTRSYYDILRRMNERFTDLLGHAWPPEGLPPQDGFWAAMEAEGDAASHARARVAVLYVDALRYAMGRALLATLREDRAGQHQTLTARLAATPTTTPIGMTAVLPHGDRRRIVYDSDWTITVDDGAGRQSGNLKDKAARIQWLRTCLGDGVNVYNLNDLLDTPSDSIPDAAYTFVFDTTLDAVGERAGVQAWRTFSTLLQAVRKGVHKLLDAGVERIHIVADHGFLLLDEVSEHEKVSVRDVPAEAKHARYVLGHHLGTTDQLSYPVPGGEGLQAWYPRGIGCFRTPGAYTYVHGGLSLQELVVPHITIEQDVLGRPVAVAAQFPAEIHNAMPQVVLTPAGFPDAQSQRPSLLAQPREVIITLARPDGTVLASVRKAVGPGEPVKEIVMLPFDCELEVGDTLHWELRDARTDEVLARQEAVSKTAGL